MNTLHPFKTGARPSPRHRLLAAVPHQVVGVTPPQFAVVPPRLSMWLNDVDGICVTAEEAFAKAAASVMTGAAELFVPDAEVQTWATAHGVLNGAVISDVLTWMRQSGFVVNGTTYDDGPASGVDYSNEAVLQNALSQGAVKIGIDHSALPQTAGQQQGWYAVGGFPGQFPNVDHCVSLCGYGPAGWLYQQLGVPLPAALGASQMGYLLFTWGSIGFVDHAWIMSTCVEAWLRSPTTIAVGPSPSPIQKIDHYLDQVIKMLAGHPAAQRFMMQVKATLDAYFGRNQSHVHFGAEAIPLHALSPAMLRVFVKMAFAAAIAALPQYKDDLERLENLVLGLLPAA